MSYPGPTKVVLVGIETTWGTAVTANRDLGLIQDITDGIPREVIDVHNISSIETQFVTSGMVEAKCSMTMFFQHGRIFEYILGSDTPVNTSSDYTHTMAITDTPPSASIESSQDSTTDTVMTYEGMLIESAELSIALNGVLTVKADWKGQSATSSTSATAKVVDTIPAFPHALVDVKINGSTATEVQNFSIKMNKVVVLAGGVKSNIPASGHATQLSFEYSGQIGFDDETYQELFMGGSTPSATSDPTVFAVEINADNGTVLGSGERSITLSLANCINSTFDISASIGGLIFMDIAGKGTFNACVIVDDIADYSA